ncbi:MAG: hypothetical protein OXL37_04490 [Chloroflexota bacterium]|nr:hypothetical protein [Chloroflexota bacterium]MDE2960969.1 hypothetical protein [Chloroflexota bacterium]
MDHHVIATRTRYGGGNLVAYTTKSTGVIAGIVSSTWEYLLHDERLEEQRRRTERERRRGEQARERAQHYRRRAEQARERAQHYRRRAEHERERSGESRESVDEIIADIHRLHSEFEAAAKALIERLEELNGGGKFDTAS